MFLNFFTSYFFLFLFLFFFLFLLFLFLCFWFLSFFASLHLVSLIIFLFFILCFFTSCFLFRGAGILILTSATMLLTRQRQESNCKVVFPGSCALTDFLSVDPTGCGVSQQEAGHWCAYIAFLHLQDLFPPSWVRLVLPANLPGIDNLLGTDVLFRGEHVND